MSDPHDRAAPGRPEPHAASLTEALGRHAREHGDRLALSYLERGETLVEETSYGDLHRAARVIAGNLAVAGLSGRPVLLVLPQGLDFVRCFLACLCAGVIAVPTPFPADRRSAARCTAIAAAVQPAAIVTTAQALADPARLRCLTDAGMPGVTMLDAAALAVGPELGGAAPAPETIAFLQYTSGSVSRPKGVAISHRNIMANLAMIRAAFAQDETNSAVSWLPLHHDMGLIGCVLQPLFLGARCVLMSPLAFLQRPLRWLRAIEAYGATTGGAPNFAYDMCVRTIPEAEARTLDLSRWQLAFCGSEPIRHRSMQRFADRFASAGFAPGSLFACYGQAEATLLVTAARRGEGMRSRALATDTGERMVVSCGVPCAGTRIVIHPSGDSTLPEGDGEICVSGAQVSPGFWDGAAAAVRPDPDRELILDGRRYLRTGDIGRIVDGELHVLGRLRDMIIVHGSNIHAEDVEATVLEDPASACLAAAAAFGIAGRDREELVVVCELERRAALTDPETLLARLSRSIANAHGVLPAELLLVASGGVERTVSGKIQRLATRARYLAGALSGTSLCSPLRRASEPA